MPSPSSPTRKTRLIRRPHRLAVALLLVAGVSVVAGVTDAFDSGAPPESDALLIAQVEAALDDVPPPSSSPMPQTPPSIGEPTNVTPVLPGRVFESRNATTVDGIQQHTGARSAGQTTDVVVAGRAGVPSSAASIFVNVTAVGPEAIGFVTIFPCGSAQPLASTLNFAPGRTVANGALVEIGDGGAICAFTSAPTHLIVDVTGFVPQGSGLEPVVPGRLFESRTGAGSSTVDGDQENMGRRAAGEVTTVLVAGRADVPPDAVAVFANVTAIGRGTRGFVTLFACGSDQPLTSTLNHPPSGAAANGALVELGPDGSICLFTSQSSDLVVDVTGYTLPDRGTAPMVPARVFETRSGPNAATIDGLQEGSGRRAADDTAEVVVSERPGIPFAAGTVFVNVTAIDPTTDGFVTLFPCGSDRPRASTLNFRPSETVANGAIVAVGDGGAVCVYTSAATHLAFDVTGFGV